MPSSIDSRVLFFCREFCFPSKDWSAANLYLALYVQLKESEGKIMALSRERDQLIKQRDSALQEAQLWRSEIAKARERAVILEAAVVRAEERARVAESDAAARIREAEQKESAATKDKQELLEYVNVLQAQLQRYNLYF